MTGVRLVKPQPIDIAMHGYMDRLLYEPGPPPSLDMSHGTNRLGNFPTLRRLIAEAIGTDRLTEYDSPLGNEALRAAIAAFESATAGVTIAPGQIVVTHGAAEGLDFVFRALSQRDRRRVLHIDPQFPTIYRAAEAAKLDVRIATSRGLSPVRWTPQEVLRTLGQYQPDVVVLSQPGNPNGQFLTADTLGVIFHWAADRDAEVVIDKACGDIGSRFWSAWPKFGLMAEEAGARVHLVDSYSKRRALPGLRVGYIVTDSETIDFVRTITVGRTTVTVAVEGVIWDLMTCTAAVLGNTGSLTIDQDSHLREVALAHEQTLLNLQLLEGRLADHIFDPWPGVQHESGINCEIAIKMPYPISELECSTRLLKQWGVGTYPVSCFEGLTGSSDQIAFRNRFTLAAPPELFGTCVDRLAEALQSLHTQRRNR